MIRNPTTETSDLAETKETAVTEPNVIYSTLLNPTSDIEMQSCDAYAKVDNMSVQVVTENSTTGTGNVAEMEERAVTDHEQSAIYSTPFNPTSDIEMQSCKAYAEVRKKSAQVVTENSTTGAVNVAEMEERAVTEQSAIYSTALNPTSDIEMQSCKAYTKVRKRSAQVVTENSTTGAGNFAETEQSAIYSTLLSPTSDTEILQSCNSYEEVDVGSGTVMEQNVTYGTRLACN